eukprot:scaffold3416_cov120-Cylindrotheca_fusiformis.AAC.5
MSKYLNGPDELERLEFISRQQLLKEDKIMRDKINNYVQLVNALTGQEVMLPADTDEYSFVSVDDDSEDYEEEYEEEYIDDDDDWDYESIEDDNDDNNNNGFSGPPPPPVAAASASQEAAVGDDANVEEEGKIENMDFVQQQQQQVDAIPPPTPSQIIRKLKATLVYAGMEQIKLRRRRSVRRLGGGGSGGNNYWSFDVAKRKLNREMKRIEKRKAYRDAIESLVPGGVGMITAEEEEKEEVSSPPQPVSDGKSILMDESEKNGQSGSIFMGLLKTLETSKRRLPAAEPTSTTSRRSINNASANPSQMMSRSDQRLQAILQKHHHNLMDQKEKIRSPSPSNPRSKNSDTRVPPPPMPPGPPLTQEGSGNNSSSRSER